MSRSRILALRLVAASFSAQAFDLRRRPATPLLLCALLLLVSPLAVAQTDSPEDSRLTLESAVHLAIASEDPSLTRFEARAEALENEAVADARLPDPKVTGSLANVPIDTFSFSQSAMTQIKLGLRQEFPAGKTLEIRARQRLAEAETERARRRLTMREIVLQTRTAWLDLFFQRRAEQILQRSHKAVREQLDSLEARFATGRMHAQDMLRAELELSLIDDRLTEYRRRAEVAQATLSRYIGRAAMRQLPDRLPEQPDPADLVSLQERLVDHPSVQVENARIQAAEIGIDLAEQAYKPAFAIEGGYGIRTDQADFASIGVTMSLPIFTDKRQDRRRAAAVSHSGARQLDRDERLHELKRQLEETWANWQRLNERVTLYQQALGERARQTAEASITTYANGQTDFAELIRSKLAELDIQLKRAELESEAAKARARLAYLTGERP